MPEMSGLSLLQSLLWFLLVIALLLATLFFLKKFGPSFGGKGGKNIRLIESCDLGPRQRVVLIEVDGERLLVGVSQNQVSLIYRLPASEISPDKPKINN